MDLKNDRILRAFRRQSVDRTPIWIMRQAGRYLPEYRKVRAQAGDFLTLCKTPELACKVTLQPLDRFDLDAAILFSDILTIPDAMGLGLHFVEGEGPRFDRVIQSERDLATIKLPDPENELRYVMDAIRLIRSELNGRVPLIGFSGSPWTLAAYMVEGKSCKDFCSVKRMLYADPPLMHKLLAILTEAVSSYLAAQIAAGAQAVMIFDTWGGLLTTKNYMDFSLFYMRDIMQRIKPACDEFNVPIIIFTKGGGQWLEVMANSGCDVLGLDWTCNIGHARECVGDRVALQGNLDPCMLFAPPERIHKGVAAVLKDYGQGSGHIFNLGHGILPNVDPEHVVALVDAVKTLSPQYHIT